MKTFLWLASSLALWLLASCASSGRMDRLSPLDSEGAPGDRVNLWPCYYSDNAYSAVLWPCFDLDERGMALRPFYNQDDQEYSILFPLAAWNPEKGDGWCLNCYWDDHNRGVVPFYWLHKDGGRKDIITPLVSYGWDPRTGKGRYLDILGPLFYWQKVGGRSFWWSLLFFIERHEHYGEVGLLPIFYASWLPEGYRWWAMPVYVDESTTALWPFFAHSSRGGLRSVVLCPFLAVNSPWPGVVKVGDHGYSVLWRLWARQERDDVVSGHVLFIPW